jgi:hypothetical protein
VVILNPEASTLEHCADEQRPDLTELLTSSLRNTMRRSCCRPICYRVNNKSRIHEQKMNRVPPAHSVLSSNAKQASQATPAASPEKPAKTTTANPHGNHAAADPATKLTTNIRPCIRSANSISLNPIVYAQVHFLRKVLQNRPILQCSSRLVLLHLLIQIYSPS